MKRMFFVLVVLALVSAGAASSTRGRAQPARPSSDPNAVLYWSQVAESTISVGRPPASSEVLNGLVHAAIYDAVVSVEGEYEPFAVSIRRVGADLGRRGRGCCGAWGARDRVCRGRPRSSRPLMRPSSPAFRTGRGRRTGSASAEPSPARIIALRSDDGFDNVVPWVQPTAGPGCVRADPVQQHPGRHQAEAGSAAVVRRPVAVPAGRPERADEPGVYARLQRGQARSAGSTARSGRRSRRRPPASGRSRRWSSSTATCGTSRPSTGWTRSRRRGCWRWCTSPPPTRWSAAGRRSSTTCSGGRRPRSSAPTRTGTRTRSRTRPGRICSSATTPSIRPATPASPGR